MSGTKQLSKGWLRAEIASALAQVVEKSYVSQGLKTEFNETAKRLNNSDRLKRPQGSLARSESAA
ncbi:hypothetical protein [Methylobacterium goesingense]|uniref:hypothetical protein n=1 Tax=Methylobacterium goesingense TaxID=243690 RepID=UPI003638C741